MCTRCTSVNTLSLEHLCVKYDLSCAHVTSLDNRYLFAVGVDISARCSAAYDRASEGKRRQGSAVSAPCRLRPGPDCSTLLHENAKISHASLHHHRHPACSRLPVACKSPSRNDQAQLGLHQRCIHAFCISSPATTTTHRVCDDGITRQPTVLTSLIVTV